MYTKQALRELGVERGALTARSWRRSTSRGSSWSRACSAPGSAPDGRGVRADARGRGRAGRARGACRAGRARASPTSSTRPRPSTDASRCAESWRRRAYLLGEIKVHGANLRDPVQGYGQQDLHCRRAEAVRRRLVGGQRHGHVRRHDARQRPDPRRARARTTGRRSTCLTSTRATGSRRRCRPEDQARVPADLERALSRRGLVTAPAGCGRDLQLPRCWHGGTPTHATRAGACCISPTRAATCRSSSCSSTT